MTGAFAIYRSGLRRGGAIIGYLASRIFIQALLWVYSMNGVELATDAHALSAIAGNLTISMDGDILLVGLRGEFGVVEEQLFRQWRDRATAQYGYRLTLATAEGRASVSPEARAMMVEWSRSQARHGSTAFLGASFAMKTVVNFVSRAIRALTNDHAPLRFFSTEAEARAWLAEERERYLSTSP